MDAAIHMSTSEVSLEKVPTMQLLAAVFVIAVGSGLAWGAFQFPVEKGYSILGPQVIPFAVAFFLIAIGAILAYQACTGGFRSLATDDQASKEGTLGAAWVSGGLVTMALLITHIGFVLSAALLFCFAARGFGSRHVVRDLGIGIGLSLPVYWIFTAGLGVSLPALVNAWI